MRASLALIPLQSETRIPKSDLDEALAREVAAAADSHGRYPVAFSFDSDMDEARASHLDSLLADDVARGEYAAAHQVTAERAARRARRGVFRDAESGREHSAVNRRALLLDLAREDEDLGRDAVRFRDALHQIDARARAARGVQASQRRVHEGHAARDYLRGQVCFQVRLFEREHRRDALPVFEDGAEGRERLRHLGDRGLAAFELDPPG